MPSMKTEVLALNSIATKSSEARLYSSRRLSRDLPIIIDTSFDVYYRQSSVGNIPFVWESQPGTPKIKSRGESPLIPPLTPPPSFHSSPMSTNPATKNRQRMKNSLVPRVLLLPKLNLKKAQQVLHHQSPSVSTSSSWSTSSSPLSSGTTPNQQHRINSSSSSRMTTSSSFDSRFGSRIEEGECDEFSSPISSLCFPCFCSSS